MKYVSKRSELTLIKKPQDRMIDEQRRVIPILGQKVEFFAGRYETRDPELIEWLHNHPLRGKKFDEITEADEQIVQKAKVLIADGPITSGNAVDSAVEDMIKADIGKVEVSTRPTDTSAVSPELIKIIDERINSALSVIVDLLKKDEVKEEKAMSVAPSTPTKTFKCPYCGEPFGSGFAVGKHKKECSKKP